MTNRVHRRSATLAVVLALAAAGACSNPERTNPSAPERSLTTTTTAVPDPVASPAWAPGPGEPAPNAKTLAAEVLRRAGTYLAGGGTPEAARGRLSGLRIDEAVLGELTPVLTTGAAAVDITYPQLGGLTDTDASVLVVGSRRVVTGGTEERTSFTIEVRLTADAQGWRVTGIPANPSRPPASQLSPVAEAVLGNRNVHLTDTSRADIESGQIDERILTILNDAAASMALSVTTLSSGHPTNVFGTTSVSNHTHGRAVDIWALDGIPIAQSRQDDGPAQVLARQLLGNGITELGGPWDLDGPGGASFTNTVHQDHLHIGFD